MRTYPGELTPPISLCVPNLLHCQRLYVCEYFKTFSCKHNRISESRKWPKSENCFHLTG